MEKDNIQRKEFHAKKAESMNDKETSNKSLRNLLVINLLVLFVILGSFSAVLPFYSKSKIPDESKSLQYPEKNIIDLYIIGLINIEELMIWVLGADRRLIVLKKMHEKKMIQASDIAETTERSLQNISYAMRELEKQGLVKCLTPEKHTWKKFILTEKGTEVFEKLKKDHFIE